MNVIPNKDFGFSIVLDDFFFFAFPSMFLNDIEGSFMMMSFFKNSNDIFFK